MLNKKPPILKWQAVNSREVVLIHKTYDGGRFGSEVAGETSSYELER